MEFVWIKRSERLPEHGQKIMSCGWTKGYHNGELIHSEVDEHPILDKYNGEFAGDNEMKQGEYKVITRVTHWAPIPALPDISFED